MSEPLGMAARSTGQPWRQFGRIGMFCALTALGAVAAMFLLRPG